MLTQFEHFAVTEMLGQPDSPPRANGTLCFGSDWERTSFGIALALAKEGYFEWDYFRDELIASIKRWEDEHPADYSSWNYYDQFLTALESAVVKTNLLTASELREFFSLGDQVNQ
ncbi:MULTISPECIES: nitrile hydratase accessory protein [Rhizobiaceae]|uniref:Nitrile hydratase accessory protein n=1 Tax=Sinorhizobium alkalisoli TaxID=1752398 RepID=A0A1E3VFG3_9HYPH|nr:nitrile hydratase accessory protein [Sinorhizobium alkalisoli]ODR92333.1 nitrile hydratase accessory protein [Sinorhizobium alkalisoli]QFI70721.1 putative transmembrane nitrile hydratase [Sinorhizobium alkalisoli]